MIAVINASLDAEYQSDIVENATSNLAVWSEHPERCVHLVAELKGKVIGVILVKEFWNLCSLFIAPEHQGKGLSRALVQEAIAACREQSHEQAILLNAAPDAVRFYLALGFEIRETAQHLPAGFKAMRYRFAASEA